MKKIQFFILGASLFSFAGCDQYQIVDTNDTGTKVIDLKNCNCEVISKGELKTLRDQADVLKHINRYQMRTEGYRTWRFDTSTGSICLLLAPDWDWKKPDVDAQNCAYVKD